MSAISFLSSFHSRDSHDTPCIEINTLQPIMFINLSLFILPFRLTCRNLYLPIRSSTYWPGGLVPTPRPLHFKPSRVALENLPCRNISSSPGQVQSVPCCIGSTCPGRKPNDSSIRSPPSCTSSLASYLSVLSFYFSPHEQAAWLVIMR